MKRIYSIFIIFFFLFLISAVNADENVTFDNSTLISDDSNVFEVEDESNLTTGYVDVVNLHVPSKIETNNLVKYYGNGSQFHFRVLDDDNNPVSGLTVVLKLNGKEYIKSTNENGSGYLVVNKITPGKYSISTSCDNLSVKNTINVLSRVSTKDISSTYGTKTKFSLTLLDKQGKLMKNNLIKFTVNGKTYNRYTNVYGVASLGLNLPAGSYTINYLADGISGKNKYSVKNYYKITTYKWKSGADVTKNKKIKNNIPNSALVKKVVKAAKSGTPVIKFKGGNGKVVFMTAGVHGNELSSQVAAMQLIQYLEKHPIK